MKLLNKYLSFFFLFFFYLLIFREWFSFNLIAAGDFPIRTNISFGDISLIPYSWGIGLSAVGGFLSPLSWNHFVNSLPIVLGRQLGLEWVFVERAFYLFPLLIMLFLTPMLLFKKLFPESKFFVFATIIFSLNSYALMIIGGGQIFLGLAYSLIPLVFYLFVRSFSQNKLFYSLSAALFFSLQLMFDLRIAYITLFAFGLLLLLKISPTKKYGVGLTYSLLIPGFITFLLHAYWIIPTLFAGGGASQSLGEEYLTSQIIPFLSFAGFENTISLLHPNWPENIFGKTYFMRPEFLILPILAFLSLIFVNGLKDLEQKRYILFFAFLGLIGAFLAKGANHPFGSIYIWLFENIPGFIMFRDPTKWYVLVAFSYSILVPYSIEKIFFYLKEKVR